MKSSSTRALALLCIVLGMAATAQALPPWKPKFKEQFVDVGPKSLQAAFDDMVIGSCKVCHVNGEEKTVRNPFGRELEKLIPGNAGERLKKAGMAGDAAMAAEQAKLDQQYVAALEKALKLKSPAGEGTYGERIKAGKLPFVPVVAAKAAVSASVAAPAGEAAVNALTEAEKKEGWKLLFDGKSADGWNSWKTKKPLELGKWTVEDGALTLGKGGGDIYTDEAFENFELSLEWKTTGNSGILIRVDPKAGGAIYGVAPEMQIDKSMGSSKTSTAALYDIYPVTGEKEIHPEGWNTVKIRMVNGEGTHWFNGHQVYTYKIGSDDWKQRIAMSKWKNSKGFAETAKGHIGLQDHGAKVSFRNVKIREIK